MSLPRCEWSILWRLGRSKERVARRIDGMHGGGCCGASSADSREAKEKSEERRVSGPVQSQCDLYLALRALQSPWRARLALVRVLKSSRELGLQALLFECLALIGQAHHTT